MPSFQGLFLIAFIQILTGVALYFCYGYLRPSLHAVSWSQLLLFTCSALFGIWGAWRRNQTVEGIYFATFLVNIVFLLLAVLDFADVLHMMPKAPPGATTSFVLLKHGRHPSVLEFVQRDSILYKGQLADEDHSLANSHHRFSMALVKTSPEDIQHKIQETVEYMPFGQKISRKHSWIPLLQLRKCKNDVSSLFCGRYHTTGDERRAKQLFKS